MAVIIFSIGLGLRVVAETSPVSSFTETHFMTVLRMPQQDGAGIRD